MSHHGPRFANYCMEGFLLRAWVLGFDPHRAPSYPRLPTCLGQVVLCPCHPCLSNWAHRYPPLLSRGWLDCGVPGCYMEVSEVMLCSWTRAQEDRWMGFIAHKVIWWCCRLFCCLWSMRVRCANEEAAGISDGVTYSGWWKAKVLLLLVIHNVWKQWLTSCWKGFELWY